MEKKRILFASQEVTPYLPETPIAKIGRELPQGIQEKGKEIRIFMPRFGKINERRNQLHEVIRLSGMNLIINDTDHPLVIKVASIQAAKMQVYFIDNEEYFKRKAVFLDEEENSFTDNDERAIFYARGVLETIKKLRWVPDVIHCHGWFSHLIPLYIKKAYNDDPIFQDTKVIYSIYDDEFPNPLAKGYSEKVLLENIDTKDLSLLEKPDFVNVYKQAIQFSDAIIMGSETLHTELESFIKTLDKPVLEYQGQEDYVTAYSDFYDQISEK